MAVSPRRCWERIFLSETTICLGRWISSIRTGDCCATLNSCAELHGLPKQRRHNEDALLMSVLTGFPDRVGTAAVREPGTFVNGGSAEVAGERPRYEFMVAVDAEDRKEKPLPLIRMASRIEPEWLIDMFPGPRAGTV